MTAFDAAVRVEAEGMAGIVEFLSVQADNGRFVLTAKGRLSSELQLRVGDALLNRDGDVFAVEWKVELQNGHDNFFLETWSNRSRFKRGWLDHLDCDILFYYFLSTQQLFTIGFQALKKWAFGSGENGGGIYSYPEKRQRKYDQLNDTWGRCVPIEVVRKRVGLTEYRRETDGWQVFEPQANLFAGREPQHPLFWESR